MQPRSKLDWLQELRGQRGAIKQRVAFIELENYLNRVGFNFLRTKVSGMPKLADLDNTELAHITSECVHDLLTQIVQNDFAELEQYREESSFLHYVATFVYNRIRRELKRVRNVKEIPFPEYEYDIVDRAATQQPEKNALVQAIMAQLTVCLEELPERMRKIFWLRRVEEISIQEVAERLTITPQIVKNDIARAEPKLRLCLQNAGYDHNILASFESV